MSIVGPAANPSLCFSPFLSTPHATRRSAIRCLPNLTSSTTPLLLKHSIRIPRASSSSSPFATEESKPSKSEAAGEGSEYEVELEKPYGFKFMKGSDGATYIDSIAPGNNADKSGKFTVGDKVIATWFAFASLFFQQTVLFNPAKNHFWGSDWPNKEFIKLNQIWSAAGYGRTMYTIRQRIGPLLMKIKKRYGVMGTTGYSL